MNRHFSCSPTSIKANTATARPSYHDWYDAVWAKYCEQFYAENPEGGVDQSTQGVRGRTDFYSDGFEYSDCYLSIDESEAWSGLRESYDRGESIDDGVSALSDFGEWHDVEDEYDDEYDDEY